MKNILWFFLLFFLMVPVFSTEIKETVAIPAFSGADTETAKMLSDLFGTRLAARSMFRVLTRTNIDAVLNETKWQMSGYTSDEDAVSLGKQLNAKYIVVGRLTVLGSLHVLYVQLIDVESAEIISGAERKFRSMEESYDQVEDLVGLMVAQITGNTWVTSDVKNFDRDKMLAQYRFDRRFQIASRITWITSGTVCVLSGAVLTRGGKATNAELMEHPLFFIPVVSASVGVGAFISDVIFSLRVNKDKKVLDSAGIQYAFVPDLRFDSKGQINPAIYARLSW